MLVRYRGPLFAILFGANTANAFVAPVHQTSSLLSLSAQQIQPDGAIGVENRVGIDNDAGYRNSYYNRNNGNNNRDKTRDALPRQVAKRASERYASNQRKQVKDYYASDQASYYDAGYGNSYNYAGYGNSYNNAGYRNSYNDAGYRNSYNDAGYGNSYNDAGYGNSYNDPGYGNSYNDAGYGNSYNDPGNRRNSYNDPGNRRNSYNDVGYGNSYNDVGYGNSYNDVGYGNSYNDVGYGNSYNDAGNRHNSNYYRNNMNTNKDKTGDALPRQRAKRVSQRYTSNQRKQQPDYYASDQASMNMDPMIGMDTSARRRRSMSGTQQSTIQGAGSRSTWVSPDPYGYDEMNIHLGTAGRPLYAQVEHWVGPNNTPSRMQLYSEDGSNQPWITKFKSTDVPMGVTEVRNTGPMEFPINARVSGPGPGSPTSNRMTKPQTIHGGSLKTFSFNPFVKQVYLEISSEGRPVNARVELWQGPSNTKAIAEIYTDNGLNRPWSALIPLSGYGGSICVINEGPMAFPFEVRMDPPPMSAF